MSELPIQILLVEDNPAEVPLLTEFLRSAELGEFDIFHVQTLGEACEQARGQVFDVILLDMNLPDSMGIDTVRRMHQAAAQAPIVVLTGNDDEEIGLASLHVGAQDYLVKGQTPPRTMARTIQYAIQRAQLQRQRQAHTDRLSWLINVSKRVLESGSAAEMLQDVAEAAFQIAGGKLSWVGHNYRNGTFEVDAFANRTEASLFDWRQTSVRWQCELLSQMKKGDRTVRLTEEQLESHAAWNVLRDDSLPLRGLLAASLVDASGHANGLVLVSESRQGEFTADDEATLLQLATIASLGLEHLASRTDANQRAHELAAIFDAMVQPVMILDEAARCTKANPAAVAALGCDPTRMLQAELLSKVRFEHAKEEVDIFDPSLSGKTFVDRPLRLTNAQGRTLSILASRSPLFEGGRLAGQVLVWQDVTERQRLIDELQASRDQLEVRVQTRTAELAATVDELEEEVRARRKAEERTAATNALLELFARKTARKAYLDGVSKLVRQWSGCSCAGVRLPGDCGTIPFASHLGFTREFCSLAGALPLAGGIGVDWKWLRDNALQADPACSCDGESFCCTRMSALRDLLSSEERKQVAPVLVTAEHETLVLVPIRHQQDTLGYLQLADAKPGQIRPETVELIERLSPLIGEALARFRVEEALRMSEEHFRLLIEHSPDCVARLSLNRTYLSVNQAGCRLLGFADSAAASGRSCLDGVVENRAGLESAVAQASLGQVTSVVYKSLGPNQNEIWWDCQLTPIRKSPNRIDSLLMVARDSTERRRLEREIVEVSDQERHRIGRDLHDALGQSLTGIAFLSKVLQKRLSGAERSEAEDAGRIASLVNQTVNQTRILARGLCPVEPKADGLMTALTNMAKDIEGVYHTKCIFTCPQPILVEDDYTATQLYYIAQEAVNNAVKHAEASRINIDLTESGTAVSLAVRDNGKGIGPRRGPATDSMGLRTMRYRSDLIGASFHVGPAEKKGTAVTCKLDLSRKGKAVPPEGNSSK